MNMCIHHLEHRAFSTAEYKIRNAEERGDKMVCICYTNVYFYWVYVYYIIVRVANIPMFNND